MISAIYQSPNIQELTVNIHLKVKIQASLTRRSISVDLNGLSPNTSPREIPPKAPISRKVTTQLDNLSMAIVACRLGEKVVVPISLTDFFATHPTKLWRTSAGNNQTGRKSKKLLSASHSKTSALLRNVFLSGNKPRRSNSHLTCRFIGGCI